MISVLSLVRKIMSAKKIGLMLIVKINKFFFVVKRPKTIKMTLFKKTEYGLCRVTKIKLSKVQNHLWGRHSNNT